MIKFVKVNRDARLPTVLAEGSPILVLYSLRAFSMRVGDRRYERTGIKVNLPTGHVGRILQYEEGIEIMTNFIGREEIYVDIINKSGEVYEVKKNGPIAKFAIEKRLFVEPQFIGDTDNNVEGNWETDEEICNFISYQYEIMKPNDGVIFSGDDHLIFNKIKMFL